MYQKVLKNGNSLAVTIPADFVKILGVKPGTDVKLTVDTSRSTLTYKFSGSGQMNLLSLKQ